MADFGGLGNVLGSTCEPLNLTGSGGRQYVRGAKLGDAVAIELSELSRSMSASAILGDFGVPRRGRWSRRPTALSSPVRDYRARMATFVRGDQR